MTTLMIKDLSLIEELSPEQLEKIHGGMKAQYENAREKEEEVMEYQRMYVLSFLPWNAD